MTAEDSRAQYLAARVRDALAAADLDAYAGLLHPEVHWGAPGDPSPPCQNRAQVLAWYRNGRADGIRAHVTETIVGADKILVGLRVSGGEAAVTADADTQRWQVLTVRDGLVADIRGFDDRDEAAAAAGLGLPS
jgi:ketosteroid isomerase-like protein